MVSIVVRLWRSTDARDDSELVPAKVLVGNLGWLGEDYLNKLSVISQFDRNEKLIHVFVVEMALFSE